MSKIMNLHDVFVEQLRDLYSAETQLVKALPKMAKAASSPELAQGFTHHLEQTKGHVGRLEIIFHALDTKATGKTCKAMEGLIKEGAESIAENATPATKDALLIAAAQRVEHYEIAGYGTVKNFAKLLGDDEALRQLEQTLEEEVETDRKLSELAGPINEAALTGASTESSRKHVFAHRH